MEAVRYTPADAAEWDAFVDRSANATFLHRRGYMDYHADRFADASLMVRDSAGKLVALLPASRCGDTLTSHAGLTYGGLLVGERHRDTAAHLEAWDALLRRMRADGVRDFVYKPVPAIYCRYPSDDDLYALFRSGATLEWCQIASAMPLDRPLLFNQNARRSIAKARRMGVSVGPTTDIAPFHRLLCDVLRERHGAEPVHTLAELELLRSRFPREIRLFTAAAPDGELLGGMLVYFTREAAHSQYIAVSDRGCDMRALPMLVDRIVHDECGGLRWFDFGTSNEDSGRILNASLNHQKYGMGGRPTAYTAWRLKL